MRARVHAKGIIGATPLRLRKQGVVLPAARGCLLRRCHCTFLAMSAFLGHAKNFTPSPTSVRFLNKPLALARAVCHGFPRLRKAL